MVRLEHVNLVVKDIGLTLDFIQTAFPEWRVRGRGGSEWYGKERKWLHVGTDDNYITLNEGFGGENRDLKSHSPGLAHIGLAVDDMESVCRRLQAKGQQMPVATAGRSLSLRGQTYPEFEWQNGLDVNKAPVHRQNLAVQGAGLFGIALNAGRGFSSLVRRVIYRR